MKKILVLYTSVGLGHKFIAENIAYHLERAGHQVVLHDILKVQEGVLVNFGTWLHSFINRRLPFVWRWLYFSELVSKLVFALRIPLAKANSENLKKVIFEVNPDCVISTQITASAATASLIIQKKFLGKFIIAFSDYHLHKTWMYDQADLYLANIPEQKSEMVALGCDPNKIVVCGITLKPLKAIDKTALRLSLGIPEQNKLVIFGSGSLGIGFEQQLLVSYLKLLTSQNQNISVVVMCGKNIAMQSYLNSLSIMNVAPLGFFENPSRLYQIADVLLTKPGGLTIAEALQAKIKILITHTLPGQEEPNYEYLITHNLVSPSSRPLTPEFLVESTLNLLSSEPNMDEASRQLITQEGREGQILANALSTLS